MIELANVAFSYGGGLEFVADFGFEDGELTAIVGENGSGKTTLLKLAVGELTPQKGEVLVDGKPLSRIKRKDLARLVSCFPQSRPIPDMTATDAVLLGRYPYTRGSLRLPAGELEAAATALARVGAVEFADRNMKTLSYGERQRVYLAMQVAQNTQNCLFDEPTNFLDAAAKFEVLELMSGLAKEGKCAVCVLHDLSLALKYADRLKKKKKGRVFADGSPEELCESGAIDNAFGVRVKRFEENGERVYGILK